MTFDRLVEKDVSKRCECDENIPEYVRAQTIGFDGRTG
jgi:hypothetical protein